MGDLDQNQWLTQLKLCDRADPKFELGRCFFPPVALSMWAVEFTQQSEQVALAHEHSLTHSLYNSTALHASFYICFFSTISESTKQNILWPWTVCGQPTYFIITTTSSSCWHIFLTKTSKRAHFCNHVHVVITKLIEHSFIFSNKCVRVSMCYIPT